MSKYIVKFKDQDCWLADWEGDPGRTMVKASAKIFKSEFEANLAIKKALEMWQHRKMSLKAIPK